MRKELKNKWLLINLIYLVFFLVRSSRYHFCANLQVYKHMGEGYPEMCPIFKGDSILIIKLALLWIGLSTLWIVTKYIRQMEIKQDLWITTLTGLVALVGFMLIGFFQYA